KNDQRIQRPLLYDFKRRLPAIFPFPKASHISNTVFIDNLINHRSPAPLHFPIQFCTGHIPSIYSRYFFLTFYRTIDEEQDDSHKNQPVFYISTTHHIIKTIYYPVAVPASALHTALPKS